MFDFGLRIRELREQHKMSQEQLGRKVERSKSVISSYENNIKVPPLDVLTQIAVVFNVSLDYLVGIDKNEMVSVVGLSDTQKDILQTISLRLTEKTTPILLIFRLNLLPTASRIPLKILHARKNRLQTQ